LSQRIPWKFGEQKSGKGVDCRKKSMKKKSKGIQGSQVYRPFEESPKRGGTVRRKEHQLRRSGVAEREGKEAKFLGREGERHLSEKGENIKQLKESSLKSVEKGLTQEEGKKLSQKKKIMAGEPKAQNVEREELRRAASRGTEYGCRQTVNT